MLHAVRATLSTYLNNNPTEENNIQSRRRNLKRRHVSEDLEINPFKRRKAVRAKGVLSRIYEYVIGRSSLNSVYDFPERVNMSLCDKNCKANSSCKTIERETVSLSSEPTERRTFVPNRQNRCGRRRRMLSQISQATILDLTNISDCESDENDVQVTKVSIDLQQNHSIIKENRRNTRSISKRALNVLETSPLTKNFRLEEKKRYKEILAQYTSVRLPDYSDVTISSTESSSITNPDVSYRRSVAESLHTSTLFERKSHRRLPVVIDLTEPSESPSKHHQTPSTKKYVDLTTSTTSPKDVMYIDSESKETSFVRSPVVTTGNYAMTDTIATSPRQHTDILNIDWVRKFRDALDPVQLERERRIKDEERKTATIKKQQQEAFEALSKKLDSSDEFPELSKEMLAKVKSALSPGNGKDIFVEGFNAQITRADLTTLRESAWLNDEVVNFYFNLVKERNQEVNKDLPKVHVFNTFFYPKIMKSGHSSVKRWTRKVDIFAMDIILIPVHLGMHWCLAVIDFKNKEIIYYDSLGGNNSGCLQALSKYVQDESVDKKKVAFDMTGWKQLMPKNIPEQMNGCDCGVFMCKYAEYKSRYANFTFKQDNMPYFRKRMIYEILTKKLMQ